MDKYTAAEEGYKRGYEKGYADGKKYAEDEIIILKQKRANIFEILDAYERGRASALKWISVTERMPEKDGKYLASKQHRYGAWQDVVGFAKYGESVSEYDLENAKDIWYNYDSEYGYYSIDSVTHWMPLPEPPSVDDVKEPSNWEPKSPTNADRIRAMTDKELAKACCEYIDCMACPSGVDCIQVGKSCEKRMLEWLQQPAQEE